MKQGHMREGSNNSCKTNTVSQRKEHTEVYPSLLLISRHVNLKLIINNGSNIIQLPLGIEQMRREDGEILGMVQVQPPVGHWDHHIENYCVAHKDIYNGKGRGNEWTAKEWGYDRPVEGQWSNAEAFHSWTDLLGRDRVGEGPADPWDVWQGGEEVAREDVPREAADESDQEEFPPRAIR